MKGSGEVVPEGNKSGDLLLVCATAFEMRAAIALLPGGPECDLSPWENAPPLGRELPLPSLPLPGGGLRLLVCGVGPVASALSLALAAGGGRAREFKGIVNLGIAGSYDLTAAPLGAMVAAEWECFPEYGVWPEGNETVPGHPVEGGPAGPGMPLPLTFAQALLPGGPVFTRLPLDTHNWLGNPGSNCHSAFCFGGSATVSGVSGTRRRARRLRELTGALVENMEGFSLALGAAALHLPFAELRAVSNEAGQRPPHGWDLSGAVAVLSKAAQALFTG